MLHILHIPSWYPENSADLRGSFFREQIVALARGPLKLGVVAPRLVSVARPRTLLTVGLRVRYEVDEGVFTIRGIRPLPPKASPEWRAEAVARLGWKLYRRYVEHSGQPDLLHVQSSVFAGCVALRISDREGVPFVVSEHSSALGQGIQSAAETRILERVTARAAQRFAVSRTLATLMTTTLPPVCGPWSVMPNMVSQTFLSAELSARHRRRFVFSHISLLGPVKRLDLVVNAFARVAAVHPEAELWIGGHGPGRTLVHKHVTELGLTDRVRFLGRLTRSEVATTLSESDALVHPSDYETFGVVCIEALAMGVPVIATQCGGPEDFVHEGNGRLVPIGDASALARAMMEILANRQTFKPEWIRAECAARFGPPSLSERWRKHYLDAAQASR